MTCLKTGAHVYLEEYGEWVYGDMHAFTVWEFANGDNAVVYVMRVSARQRVPISIIKHFTIHKIDSDWQDQPYGTIVATSVTNYSYEGVPIDAP